MKILNKIKRYFYKKEPQEIQMQKISNTEWEILKVQTGFRDNIKNSIWDSINESTNESVWKQVSR